MRRRLIILTALTCAVFLTGALTAWAAATTEIDRADARFDLTGQPRVTHCAGEDSATYTQYTVAAYTGGQGDSSPPVPGDLSTGGLDHGLSGPLTWKSVKVTFNDLTGRGVAKGAMTLTQAGTTLKVYSGTMTLIVQRDPAGGPVNGRGWLSANTFDATGVKDGMVMANVEVQFTPDLKAITGIFGEVGWPLPSGPVPPLSVETGLRFIC